MSALLFHFLSPLSYVLSKHLLFHSPALQNGKVKTGKEEGNS